MDFHEVQTTFTWAKRFHPKHCQGGPAPFYYHAFQEAAERHTSNPSDPFHSQILVETQWYAEGKPYYRIYADYVDMFSQTQLQVPLRHLSFPHNGFAIRFPIGHEPCFGEARIASVIAAKRKAQFWFDRTVSLGSMKGAYFPGSMDDDVLIFSSMSIEGIVRAFVLVLPVDRQDDTLECVLANRFPDSNQLIRQLVSVCFLATGMDKVVEPDVLNKDFQKYLDAVNCRDDKTIAALSNKANAIRGSKGFAIGRTESLLGKRAYDIDTTATHDADGRDLKYRHERKAHFHLYWTGKERTVPKVRFNRMLIVRPDLPADPRAKGFRTLKSKAELEGATP